MVALNKTYQKTLTPDRSAKDSGLRYYSAEISRWLNRDPMGEDTNPIFAGPYQEGWLVFIQESYFHLSAPTVFGRAELANEQLALYIYARNRPCSQIDALGQNDVDPCALALATKKKEVTAAWASTVCYKGKAYPCVWGKDSTATPKLTKQGLLDCAKKHEECHVSDPNLYCDPCETDEITAQKKKKGVTKKMVECPAWKVFCDCAKEWYNAEKPTVDTEVKTVNQLCIDNKKACGTLWK